MSLFVVTYVGVQVRNIVRRSNGDGPNPLKPTAPSGHNTSGEAKSEHRGNNE